MTRVKICGIQEAGHAIAAAEAGADFIGLVFVPGRRRCLTVKSARAIIEELKSSVVRPPQVVGLFADQPPEEVNHTVGACGLDLVQLCGRESIDYCQQVRTRVIKVLHVSSPSPAAMTDRDGAPALDKSGPGGISVQAEQPGKDNLESSRLSEELRAYQGAECLVTLDRLVDGLQGGTGQSFNWEIAARLGRQGHSFLLAGGLTPDNVAQAVAAVHPWGVDVSSGVETGGVKDPHKIRDFIRIVQDNSSG